MDRVTLRLPSHVVRAYDEAAGNRSALMRRQIVDAVADGELIDVPPDLQTLAERESAVDNNALGRARGKFRQRTYDQFSRAWETGAVTTADAKDRATSYRREGALYGPSYVAFVDAIITWWEDNYRPGARETPGFPPAKHFVAAADPDAVDVADELVDVVENAAGAGAGPDDIRRRLTRSAPEQAVEQAITEVYEGERAE